MRFRSLKSQLAWTYAGLALLTAAILGAVMLSMLAGYYARSEQAYLRAAFDRVMRNPPRREGSSGYDSWAKLAAIDSQTRVRLVAGDGTVLADSGSPDLIDPRAIGDADGTQQGTRESAMPAPLGAGLFGEADSSRSSTTYREPVRGYGLPANSAIVLSESPTSASTVLLGVSEAWLVAAVLATVLSALAGRLVARRIARPIGVLTTTSDRITRGDLGARADVRRDDEVGRLAASFNEMAERNEATVTALRRFVGDAAHEIGTPLTALQADLELAEGETDTPDHRRLIARARVQTTRLATLSGNLLRLSRLEAGEQARPEARLDLNGAARQAADAIASRAEQAGLDLDVDIVSGALLVAADSDELQGAIDNLLDNAVKFTPQGGVVTISTRRAGDRAVLRVSDTGPGVPVLERERVFDRFHRAPQAPGVPGSGLGLAIVRATVDRFGGSISIVDSASGAVFEIVLPLDVAAS